MTFGRVALGCLVGAYCTLPPREASELADVLLGWEPEADLRRLEAYYDAREDRRMARACGRLLGLLHMDPRAPPRRHPWREPPPVQDGAGCACGEAYRTRVPGTARCTYCTDGASRGAPSIESPWREPPPG